MARTGMPWYAQVLIAIGPAIVSGVVSYQIAILQANATTKERTDTAYEELVKAVEKLQAATEANNKDVQALRDYVMSLAAQAGRGPQIEAPAILFDRNKLYLAIPRNLDRAIALRHEGPQPG